MKQLIFTALFISAITCKSMQAKSISIDSSSLEKKEDSSTIAGSWQLLPLLASDTAAGKIPQLNFDLKTNRFSGNTGCNAMGGNFIIKTHALSFTNNIISTKMACAGYNEKIFVENLLKTNRYQIKNGVLQLMYNENILSKWVRHNDTTTTKQI